MSRPLAIKRQYHNEVISAYERGKTVPQLAEWYGVKPVSVLTVLHQHGIEIRQGFNARPKRAPRLCSIDYCGKPHHAHGYCQAHNMKLWRMTRA